MIIAITNQKGGVGKTTTAINLSAALAGKSLRTLLVDLDPQANSSLSFVDIHDLEGSMYDVLADSSVGIADIIVPAEKVPNLDIAPSHISLAKLEGALVGQFDSHFRLKDALAKVSRKYDYIVLDTPPTLGIITVNALVASGHAIVPIQSSYYALEGTDDLLETIDRIKKRGGNPRLQILGVLITLHDRRTLLGRDIQKEIEKVFGEKLFNTVITKSVRLEESPAYREPIFSFAPRSASAYQYYALAEEVLSRV